MTPEPTCGRCGLRYSDPVGCSYADDETPPVRYGQEREPTSIGDLCNDCGAGRGAMHHPDCDVAQCATCGGQWVGCLGECAA